MLDRQTLRNRGTPAVNSRIEDVSGETRDNFTFSSVTRHPNSPLYMDRDPATPGILTLLPAGRFPGQTPPWIPLLRAGNGQKTPVECDYWRDRCTRSCTSEVEAGSLNPVTCTLSAPLHDDGFLLVGHECVDMNTTLPKLQCGLRGHEREVSISSCR